MKIFKEIFQDMVGFTIKDIFAYIFAIPFLWAYMILMFPFVIAIKIKQAVR